MGTPITEENLQADGWEQLEDNWPWMHTEVHHVYVDFINYAYKDFPEGTRPEHPEVRVGCDAWTSESVPADGCKTMEQLRLLLGLMTGDK